MQFGVGRHDVDFGHTVGVCGDVSQVAGMRMRAGSTVFVSLRIEMPSGRRAVLTSHVAEFVNMESVFTGGQMVDSPHHMKAIVFLHQPQHPSDFAAFCRSQLGDAESRQLGLLVFVFLFVFVRCRHTRYRKGAERDGDQTKRDHAGEGKPTHLGFSEKGKGHWEKTVVIGGCPSANVVVRPHRSVGKFDAWCTF